MPTSFPIPNNDLEANAVVILDSSPHMETSNCCSTAFIMCNSEDYRVAGITSIRGHQYLELLSQDWLSEPHSVLEVSMCSCRCTDVRMKLSTVRVPRASGLPQDRTVSWLSQLVFVCVGDEWNTEYARDTMSALATTPTTNRRHYGLEITPSEQPNSCKAKSGWYSDNSVVDSKKNARCTNGGPWLRFGVGSADAYNGVRSLRRHIRDVAKGTMTARVLMVEKGINLGGLAQSFKWSP